MNVQMNNDENISLYIPHVFPNLTDEYIKNVFEEQKIGEVSHIDIVTKIRVDGNTYNTVYVHFKKWYENENALQIKNTVQQNKEAKFMYNEPWYWIVLENKSKKYVSGERKQRVNVNEVISSNSNDQNTFTPVKAMTNKDFSDLVNAPLKKQNDETFDFDEMDEDFKTFCRDLSADFENQDENNQDENNQDEEFAAADENIELVSADYVGYIEYSNAQLRAQLETLSQMNAILKSDLIFQENVTALKENRAPMFRPYWL